MREMTVQFLQPLLCFPYASNGFYKAHNGFVGTVFGSVIIKESTEKLPLANTMGNSYNNTIENVDQE